MGLKGCYKKTEKMGSIEKGTEAKYGKINRTEKFKYLVEWIQPNRLYTEPNMKRARKQKLAYSSTS